MANYNIVFSEEAVLTFQVIKTQISDRFGLKEVAKFEIIVLKTLDLIAKFPLGFKTITEDPTVRKALIHKHCSVFYQIGDTKIEILFFWDNRQEPII